jgi:1,4-dihydroxy-2-naphthoate octaprenyltransferase
MIRPDRSTEVTMREIASVTAIVIGGLLFAAGVVTSSPWLTALGLIVMPVGLIYGLRG